MTKFNEKDVINLVIEARKFWQELCHEDGSEALDKALEPFSALVPYEDEPESEMPRDEAIEYVCAEYFGYLPEKVKDQADQYEEVIEMARLIQQYEPNRLKPAVDVAAEKYAIAEWGGSGNHTQRRAVTIEDFKAGAAWQKENG